jgi:hypothetical protein
MERKYLTGTQKGETSRNSSNMEKRQKGPLNKLFKYSLLESMISGRN